MSEDGKHVTPKVDFLILAIIEGWGLSPDNSDNPIASAENFARLAANYPSFVLNPPTGKESAAAFGELLSAQAINMEPLDLTKNSQLLKAIKETGKRGGNWHILVWDDGDGQSMEQALRLNDFARRKKKKLEPLFHLITPKPDSETTARLNSVVTVTPWEFGADRRLDFDKTKIFYETLTKGPGPAVNENDLILFITAEGASARQIAELMIAAGQTNCLSAIDLGSDLPIINLKQVKTSIGLLQILEKSACRPGLLINPDRLALIGGAWLDKLKEPDRLAVIDTASEVDLIGAIQEMKENKCKAALAVFSNLTQTQNIRPEDAEQIVKTIDKRLGELAEYVSNSGGMLAVVSPYGWLENPWDHALDAPRQEISSNPLPLVLVADFLAGMNLNRDSQAEELELASIAGNLSDVVPTLFEFLKLSVPDSWKGRNLIADD